MKNIYIMGECFTNDLEKTYKENNVGTNGFFWGHPGMSASQIRLKDNPNISHIKDEKDGVVIVWLGYVDIGWKLVKNDNSEIVIPEYIDKLEKHFKKSKLIIAEPVMPPEYRFEKTRFDKIEVQNKKFKNELRQTLYNKNIDIIYQEEILESLNLKNITKNEFINERVAGENKGSLKKQHREKILELFLNRADEV
jgi:hypothetical protein